MTERSSPRTEASKRTQHDKPDIKKERHHAKRIELYRLIQPRSSWVKRPAVVFGDDDDALSGKKQPDQRAYRRVAIDQKIVSSRGDTAFHLRQRSNNLAQTSIVYFPSCFPLFRTIDRLGRPLAMSRIVRQFIMMRCPAQNLFARTREFDIERIHGNGRNDSDLGDVVLTC